jgi:hypothetical protein
MAAAHKSKTNVATKLILLVISTSELLFNFRLTRLISGGEAEASRVLCSGGASCL